MSVGGILRLFMIVTGIVLMGATFSSLAKRKMTESVCLAWGLVSAVCVLAGLLLKPYGIAAYVSKMGLLLIMVSAVAVICAAFYVSTKLSELARKNHELAVQVSLLNHENYAVLKRLEELEEELEEKPEQRES